MREILFRGISEVTDEWVYGYLVKTRIGGNEYFSIVPYDDLAKTLAEKRWFQVIPETVGQYTGLTDKNGKKIFDGDIVKEKDVIHNGEIQIKGYTYAIKMAEGCWFATYGEMVWFLGGKSKELEIVGTIHDNPELLKGGVDNAK